MAAGYKDWTAGATLTAADLEDYTVAQSIMRFASAAARDTALSAVKTEGMFAYLIDTNTLTVYTGSAWSTVGPVHGAWTSWTPVVVQGATPTLTSTSTYVRMGRLIIARYSISITSAGTAANGVKVSLPVTAATNGVGSLVGEAVLFDSSASLAYRSLAALTASTQIGFYSTDTAANDILGGIVFTDALANGDTIFGTATYEAAADA